jgi:hypothetical protein
MCATLSALACSILLAWQPEPGDVVRLPPVDDAGSLEAVYRELAAGPTYGAVAVPPPAARAAGPQTHKELWTSQWMPDGLIYRSYLAGVKEPRMATVWSHEKDIGPVWDVALGGRLGIWRYGTAGARPDGWQVDFEGGAFPRLDPDGESNPLIAVDFRAGFPLTYGCGPWHFKLAYYHISAHAGDEFLAENPGFERINYTRDSVVLGAGYYWTDALRLYGEVGYAAGSMGGAEPWELQFGADFSPPHTTTCGSPFAAVNGHLREDVNFGGNLVVQAGWQWRQGASGRVSRLGLQYYNGMNEQYQFFRVHEDKLGFGVWLDY